MILVVMKRLAVSFQSQEVEMRSDVGQNKKLTQLNDATWHRTRQREMPPERSGRDGTGRVQTIS
jgi:hypothetical protein